MASVVTPASSRMKAPVFWLLLAERLFCDKLQQKADGNLFHYMLSS
jgi:hypothetical protein